MAIFTTVTADEMQSHKLPAVEITCQSLVPPARFHDSQTPLYFSGPPGGPDFLYLQVIENPLDCDPFSLDAEVLKHDRPGQNFKIGEASQLEIAGEKRLARCWSIHVTPWLDARATAFIAVPESQAIVLITFSAWTDAENNIVTHHIQRMILNTLTITPRPQ
ncbi:MAG: hypothetical protein KDB03_11800 [Planctomycetales bacterium]|nr:hypothetical protein [Planctomycetales bacterium]